jgi:Tol biopolymer transport system component
VLYLATGINTANPVVTQWLTPPVNPPASYPYSQTRPDWSWVTGEVAFSGAPSNHGDISVHIKAAGAPLRVVPDSLFHIYPIWSSDGTKLITYNQSSTAAPVNPVTTLIDPSGIVIVPNLNGYTSVGTAMFGGFAAPQPSDPFLIAYAGQPALANWGAQPGIGYNQDNNYVFVNSITGAGYASVPLEPAASVTTFDPTRQGRAPYWSPDGNYIVFDSSRASGGYALFLANVAKVRNGAAPVQITDAAYGAQHGKFLPGGKSIVLTALQPPSAAGTGPRGIAIIDISAYL